MRCIIYYVIRGTAEGILAITAAILREVTSRGGVPMQEMIVRNDSHCGSTIGPMMSAKLGMRTVGEWT